MATRTARRSQLPRPSAANPTKLAANARFEWAALRKHHFLLGALVIFVATFVAYSPVWQCGYIWDDDDYVSKNINLRTLDGLWSLWVPKTTRQYYPVVFSTFWIEYQLWGLNPLGYHLINLLLHALNGVLVWRVARMINIPGAWALGAVFALHPVHVESVAWITERKNVLSGLFYLLAMIAYLQFDSHREIPRAEPGAKGRGLMWYFAALGLFILALLSKSVTCSLPAALVLVRLWKHQSLRPVPVIPSIILLLIAGAFAEIGADIKVVGSVRWPLAGLLVVIALFLSARQFKTYPLAPLIPFFIVGLGFAFHTAYLERESVGAVGPEFDFSFAERLLIASNALLFYPWKLLIPWPLMFIYPRWELDASELISYWPVAVVLVIGASAIWMYMRGTRGPALGLAYFAGTVFPALGFFNVYPMRYSFVADHFQYLASLGILALVIAAAAKAIRNRTVATGALVAVLIGFGMLVWQRCWVYQSEETLWRVTTQQNRTAWMAYINLARIFTNRGETDQAMLLIDHVLQHNPEMQQARAHLAWTHLRAGRHQEALREYEALQQKYGQYETNIGQAYQAMGDLEQTERWYRLAINQPQAVPGAMVLLSHLLLLKNHPHAAIDLLEQYLTASPTDAFARIVLADAYAMAGEFDRAIEQGEQALHMAQEAHEPVFVQQVELRLIEYRANRVPKEWRESAGISNQNPAQFEPDVQR